MCLNWIPRAIRFFAQSKSNLVRKGGRFIFTSVLSQLGKMGTSTHAAFGSKILTVPANHPILWSMTYLPQMNWNLGRLAKAVEDEDPTSTMIDVGANIGDSYAIIRGSGVSSKVVCVEGATELLPWLLKNIEGDPNAVVWEGFVGLGGMGMEFEIQSNLSGVIYASADTEGGVKTQSLDQIIEKLGTPVVRLLKVDTDGFDTLVTRSAEGILRRDHPVLFLEIQPYHLMRNDNVDGFLSWLRGLEYDSAVCWDNLGRFVCEIPLAESRLLTELMAFFHGAPEMPFLDIAFFHRQDRLLMRKVVDRELEVACRDFRRYEEVARKSLHTLHSITPSKTA